MLMDNPIWFRERRARQVLASRRRWWRRTVDGGILVVWLLPVVMSMLIGLGTCRPTHFNDVRALIGGAAYISLILQIPYFCFRALVGGAGAVARERELQTLDTLLSTPLSVSRLMSGKFAVVALPLVWEAAMALPLSLMLLFWDGSRTNSLLCITGLWVLSMACIVFFTSLGLMLSATACNTSRATSRAVLLGAVLFVGTYLADVLIWATSHDESTVLFMFLNPYAALASLFCASGMVTSTSNSVWKVLWMGSVVAYLGLARVGWQLAVNRLSRAVKI